MTHAKGDGTASWLDAFRERLLAPEARAFVQWADVTAGPGIVLDRGQFGPDVLKPWLGNITILRWDAAAGDYSYRLFGSHLPDVLGRDLTGRTLAAWPPSLARVKRDRLHTVVSRRVPFCAQTAMLHYRDGQPKRGYGVLEQVMWPLRFAPGEPDGVLDLTVPVPDDSGLNAMTLRDQTGRSDRWFSADGGPLEAAPLTAGP